MVSAGEDLVKGFKNGLERYISQAVNAARALATEVLNAIKNTLGIQSPSKETYELGKFFDAGLAYGVKDYTRGVITEVNTLGRKAVDEMGKVLGGISDYLDTDVNLTPTIVPVVDMTHVEKSFGDFETKHTVPIDLSLASRKASDISLRSNQTVNPREIALPDDKKQVAPVISYVQNNYSPKELSRIDIYRQTRNQLAALRSYKG